MVGVRHSSNDGSLSSSSELICISRYGFFVGKDLTLLLLSSSSELDCISRCGVVVLLGEEMPMSFLIQSCEDGSLTRGL